MNGKAVNLALRFVLEMASLVFMGVWGWQIKDSNLRFLPTVLIPLVAAAVWGIFAVPNDPSRSGKAPVPVYGIIRLIIEFFFFGFAVFCAHQAGYSRLSMFFGGSIVLHYAISFKRICWLLKV